MRFCAIAVLILSFVAVALSKSTAKLSISQAEVPLIVPTAPFQVQIYVQNGNPIFNGLGTFIAGKTDALNYNLTISNSKGGFITMGAYFGNSWTNVGSNQGNSSIVSWSCLQNVPCRSSIDMRRVNLLGSKLAEISSSSEDTKIAGRQQCTPLPTPARSACTAINIVILFIESASKAVYEGQTCKNKFGVSGMTYTSNPLTFCGDAMGNIIAVTVQGTTYSFRNWNLNYCPVDSDFDPYTLQSSFYQTGIACNY